MTTEQLNTARAEAWHQAGNPLLTADDASSWLAETGICLFLPRGQQLSTAAPSFVEATLGTSNPTPGLPGIEEATRLLHRLVATGGIVALRLLGGPGDQPDFLATSDTLPFLFALVGDKEWKRGPRGKSSPLVIEVWKLLDREGPLTAVEVKEKLGRQLTETAAARALGELWLNLRIEPVYRDGEATAWQLLERNRQKQMQAGSTMSQAVALSALVSLYLQSAIAASSEEIEVFLSPLASRSKIRDVLKGLTATRQLGILNLGPIEMFHLEGSLAEFPEIARPEGAVVEATEATSGAAGEPGGIGEGRRRFVASRLADPAASTPPAARPPRTAAPREADKRPGKPQRSAPGKSTGDRKSGGARYGSPARPPRDQGDRRPFAPRPPAAAASRPPAAGAPRKPYGTRSAPGGASFNPREPWKEDRKPAPPLGDRPRPAAGRGPTDSPDRRPFERKPYSPGRPDAGRAGHSDRPSPRKSFGPPAGPPRERKPYAPRGGDDRSAAGPRAGSGRKPFPPRSGDRPFKPRAEGRPFTARDDRDRKPYPPRETGRQRPPAPDRPFKPRADGRPASPRNDRDRKPYPPREAGGRTSYGPPRGDRPFKPRSEDQRPGGADRKPYAPRDTGDRKAPRPAGRKPFAPGDRPFKPRAEGRPAGDRKPFQAERRPRPAGENAPERRPASPRTDRPARPSAPRKAPGAGRTSPFTSSGKPRPGVRPGASASRPARPGKPPAHRTAKPRKGPRK